MTKLSELKELCALAERDKQNFEYMVNIKPETVLKLIETIEMQREALEKLSSDEGYMNWEYIEIYNDHKHVARQALEWVKEKWA